MEIQFTLEEIHQAAQKILSQKLHKVVLFHGGMGAGKTTMIKALSKALGVSNATSSPTFSLVNEYETDKGEIIYHFDVYRLNNESEAYDMGIDEYLYSGEWCFIEWAEKIPSLIPSEHSTVTIKVGKDGKRKLTLK